MLLGKRPRGPIKRTTSMKGINVDLGDVDAMEPSDVPQNPVINGAGTLGAQEGHGKRNVVVAGPSGFDHRLMATVSPRYHKRSSGLSGGGGDHMVVETAHFLRTCGLCKRRLTPGRDIYMYRGDTAFCSLECREQQMKHDERKEKCSAAVSKKDETHHRHHSSAPATATATSEA